MIVLMVSFYSRNTTGHSDSESDLLLDKCDAMHNNVTQQCLNSVFSRCFRALQISWCYFQDLELHLRHEQVAIYRYVHISYTN